MRTLIGTMLAMLGWAAPAIAASNGVAKGTSILLILFLGFAALIIVFQFIPGLVLFFSMLRGLFKAQQNNDAGSNDKK
jgi:hypothetical protein